MSKKGKANPLKIFLMFSQNNKPDRERMAGFLRYNAMLPVKWDVRTLDGSSSALYDRCRRLCIDWNPDACAFRRIDLAEHLTEALRCAVLFG